MTFYRWKGLPPTTALSFGNCSLPATTLSYLSSRAKPRDLQFTSPATNPSWKRRPPHCHPACPGEPWERSASQTLSHNERFIARSRRTSAILVRQMLFRAFRLQAMRKSKTSQALAMTKGRKVISERVDAERKPFSSSWTLHSKWKIIPPAMCSPDRFLQSAGWAE